MPGSMVKDWELYEELREKGYTKASAARIANANARRDRTRSKKSKKRQRRKAK